MHRRVGWRGMWKGGGERRKRGGRYGGGIEDGLVGFGRFGRGMRGGGPPWEAHAGRIGVGARAFAEFGRVWRRQWRWR